jgi:preprotein translocase subunit SecA
VKKESDNYFKKNENQYMADNNREMHKIDEALYFVIEEKNNQVELTDHGIKFFQEILTDFYSSRYWN